MRTQHFSSVFSVITCRGSPDEKRRGQNSLKVLKKFTCQILDCMEIFTFEATRTAVEPLKWRVNARKCSSVSYCSKPFESQYTDEEADTYNTVTVTL